MVLKWKTVSVMNIPCVYFKGERVPEDMQLSELIKLLLCYSLHVILTCLVSILRVLGVLKSNK